MTLLRQRLAKLEACKSGMAKPRVIRMELGETPAEATARLGVTWPVAILPRPCLDVAEWMSRYGPRPQSR